MKKIRWLSRLSDAWYWLGAWVTVKLWQWEDDPRPVPSLHSGLVDRRHEMVVHGAQTFRFPDHPVVPRKTVVFDDLHVCGGKHLSELEPLFCTRPQPHDGPCNGWPAEGCMVYDDKLGHAVPFSHTVDIGEALSAKKTRSKPKKRKSTKALAPKRKPKAGKKTVARKKRA